MHSSRSEKYWGRLAQQRSEQPQHSQISASDPVPQFSYDMPRSEADIAVLRRERSELHEQLFEAAQIQRRLSGPRLLCRGELHCAREVFAARYVSGDFATFCEHNGKLFAAIGDIAGKGTPAGMWFTHLVGLLQRYAVSGADPAQVAVEVNRHLCCLRPLAPFVTMFLAEFDPYSGEFVYCNAGHFPPAVLRRDRSSTLQQGGPLLGALFESRYEIGEDQLHPGDTLLAYTDGIVECRNHQDEEFGLNRLVARAQKLADDPAELTLLTLFGTVQDFAAGMPVCDDMSLMLVRRNAGEAR